MKRILANFLTIAIFMGLVGYIGFNIKKANPDFGKEFKVSLPEGIDKKIKEKKREELEKNIHFEKINYSDIKEVDIKLGKKTVKNMIKYLKYIEVYHEEFYDVVPFIHDRNVQVLKMYNELYNKDLINNEIVGNIDVVIDIGVNESNNYMAGQYDYKAFIPLSNKTTKEINGRIHLKENNQWLCDITGHKFDNALEEFYGKGSKVTFDAQKTALEMFKTELVTLVEMVQNGESYENIKKILDKDRGSLNQKGHDKLVKLLKDANFKVVNLKIEPNQSIYKKKVNHKSGKKAYRYTIFVEIETSLNNKSIYYKDDLGVYEVGEEVSLSDSYIMDFIQSHK